MKTRKSYDSGSVIGVLLVVSLLAACRLPPVTDNCPVPIISDQVPVPAIRSVQINGQIRDPDTLLMGALEEDLLVELQPIEVDSYFFRIEGAGLNPCGIATVYPQMHFTYLPGGAHQLEYWALKNGVSSKRSTLAFYVKEALTEKTWFYPAVVAYLLIIAGAIVYFWALYNIRQRLKMQHIRSRIAADLHDEVSSDLSSIAISMITLERRAAKSADFAGALEEIKQTLADTQNNLSDTVWAIKPNKDTSGELFQRMQKFAQQMFASSEIRLLFQVSIPPEKPIKISMEQRHNIFKIYKEVIHNIYKHAAATEVEVKIFPQSAGIGIEIRDNGIGFDPAATYDGSGISNYQWRAKEGFIEFQLTSSPGKGCLIQMTIPQF